MTPKVFCIGFHKTGTTSLGAALSRLGFRVCGAVGVRDPRIAERAQILVEERLGRFDAFRDNPWPVLYAYLDRRCPGSKFILTIRDEDQWFASACHHFGSEDTPMRTWIYGVGHPVGHGQTYKRVFSAHNEAVQRYFSGRRDDLLVMNITEGDGWRELCRFLDLAAPSEPFPKLNQRGTDEIPPLLGSAAVDKRI